MISFEIKDAYITIPFNKQIQMFDLFNYITFFLHLFIYFIPLMYSIHMFTYFI